MNSHFPILSALSALIRLVGIIFLFGGIYVAAAKPGSEPRGNNPYQQQHNRQQQQDYFDQPNAYFYFGGGSVLVLLGLGALICGEVVGVLFAIEQNTRNKANNVAS